MPTRKPLLAAPEKISKDRTSPFALNPVLETIVQKGATSRISRSIGSNPILGNGGGTSSNEMTVNRNRYFNVSIILVILSYLSSNSYALINIKILI